MSGETEEMRISIRPLSEGDDFSLVARFIYRSDDYIYPAWFGSEEIGARVIAEMIRRPTVYRKEHIKVAVSAGKIVGMIVSCASPLEMTESDLEAAFFAAGVPCDLRTHETFEDYYKEMCEERAGYYVANIFVEEGSRRHGVAAALLAAAVEGKPLCFLECVKENFGALDLYRKLGFLIEKEYLGACAVPCYKMVRSV